MEVVDPGLGRLVRSCTSVKIRGGPSLNYTSLVVFILPLFADELLLLSLCILYL